jgi:SP family general alpha glucoside:H+ symporter-like MFS transporter
VVFLQAAGFSELQAFDVNIALSACYIIGGIICWFLMPRLGRATIYMGGLTAMFFVLVTIGGLGWTSSTNKNRPCLLSNRGRDTIRKVEI